MTVRLAFLASLLLPAFAAAGPTGTLYMTVDDGAFLGLLRGSDESYRTTVSGAEGPIAVAGTVRTTGLVAGGIGASYSLQGAFAGDFYTNALGDARDAASDGRRNYVLSGNGVYETGLDFGGAREIFAVSAFERASGIAYAPKDGTLWVNVDGFLTNYSVQGDVLGGFGLGLSGYTALAYDPSDDTLWTGLDSGNGSFLNQYGTDGRLLQSLALASGSTVVGMEFNTAVPEPASLAALGLGLAAFARRRLAR